MMIHELLTKFIPELNTMMCKSRIKDSIVLVKQRNVLSSVFSPYNVKIII